MDQTQVLQLRNVFSAGFDLVQVSLYLHLCVYPFSLQMHIIVTGHIICVMESVSPHDTRADLIVSQCFIFSDVKSFVWN